MGKETLQVLFYRRSETAQTAETPQALVRSCSFSG